MKLRNRGIVTSVGYPFALAAICGLTLAPASAFAVEEDGDASSEASSDAVVSEQSTNASKASEKSETVYLFSNPDGTVKSTEVSTTLKNPYGATQIEDQSDLTDIENAESDRGYTAHGKTLNWDADGDDVYYTGNSSKQAPVSIVVTYFLDGQKTSADKLAGASGRLKIRYDYENTATFKTKINGKTETLYVPFTFVTAMLFDNENFKNAEVTNGKLIDDGDRAIVAGYAMPGLKKSLGSIVDDFDIPDYFEVEADVTDFEMKTSLTIATSGLLADMNTDDIDTSKLEDASSELADAMGQILDGANTLSDGLDKLADGAKSAATATGKLAEGADSVAEGNETLANGLSTMKDSTSALPDGVSQLAKGAESLANGLPDAVKGLERLEAGAGSLTDGLNTLKEGLSSAEEGADKLSNGLEMLNNGDGETSGGLVAAQAGADQLANGLSAAKGSLATLSEAKQGVDGAKAIVDGASSGISSAADGVSAQLKAISQDNMTDTDKQALQGALGGIDTIKAASRIASGDKSASDLLATVSAGLDAVSTDKLDEAIAGAEQISAGLGTAIAVVDQLKSGSDSLGEGIGKATAGLGDSKTEGTLINGASQLENGAAQLKGDKKSGLTAAAGGASQLSSGLDELNDKIPAMISAINKIVKGADKLSDGSSTLAKGAHALDDGLGTLADGADSAAEGSGKLVEGLETFNEEGIGEITDLIDEDLLPFTDRLDALSKAGGDYDNFAGITKGTKGSVKFIFETDPIEIADDDGGDEGEDAVEE